MSVVNVVDKRSNEHNTFCDAVFEIFFIANSYSFQNDTPPIFPHTQERLRGDEHWTEWMDNTTVYSAIMSAMEVKAHVTVFLYDKGKIKGNITPLSIIHPLMNDKRMPAPYWLK